eukprot:g25029.t1
MLNLAKDFAKWRHKKYQEKLAAEEEGGRPAAPPLENGVEFRIKGSSTLSMFLCAAVVATGAQRSGILRRSRDSWLASRSSVSLKF